jgi:hypothetical protein
MKLVVLDVKKQSHNKVVWSSQYANIRWKGTSMKNLLANWVIDTVNTI